MDYDGFSSGLFKYIGNYLYKIKYILGDTIGYRVSLRENVKQKI